MRATPVLLDRVQWRHRGRDDTAWSDFGPERPCRVISRTPRETDDGYQPQRPSTHVILQRTVRGLSPGSYRALVRESGGREEYELNIVGFKDVRGDSARHWQEVLCEYTGRGNPVS